MTNTIAVCYISVSSSCKICALPLLILAFNPGHYQSTEQGVVQCTFQRLLSKNFQIRRPVVV